VPVSRKAWLAAKAMMGGLGTAHALEPQIAPQGAHLVHAVLAMPAASIHHAHNAPIKRPWWDMQHRMLWLLDLFERLERREAEERARQIAEKDVARTQRAGATLAIAE
jgi:hypothetical protein